MARSAWTRARANASLSWRWFKYWRRRYVWLRLVILVLIFAEPVHGVFRPTIRELVVIAIQGIETAKVGPRLYARAYEFQEKKRLQGALLAKFDTDGNGLLSRVEGERLTAATGLAGDEVAGSGLDVELDPLVEASHGAGVLSRVVSGTDIRRRVMKEALAEREAEHQALWREVEPMLDATRNDPADWLERETWVRGFDHFRAVLAGKMPGGIRYFGGLYPGRSPWAEWRPEQPKGLGWIGWVGLAAMVVLCVRRYGKGEELRRRFEEEAELAQGPCPVCKEPTHDYGALIQHRGTRAWATGAVVGLATSALAAVGSTMGGEVTQFGILSAGALVGMVAGGLRWWLWPREVHACHRRGYLRAVGFAVSAIVVAALVWSIAGAGMRALGRPRRPAVRAGRSAHIAAARRESRGMQGRPAAGRGAGMRSGERRGTVGRQVAREGAARGQRAGGRSGPSGDVRSRGGARRR